jgi:hypothetical protein
MMVGGPDCFRAPMGKIPPRYMASSPQIMPAGGRYRELLCITGGFGTLFLLMGIEKTIK